MKEIKGYHLAILIKGSPCKHEFKKYHHDQGLKFILVFFPFCMFGKGKYSPGRVEVLPLDLSSGEESLKEAVQKAESLFSGAGVDYMVHNAAFERPVSIAFFIFLFLIFSKILYYCYKFSLVKHTVDHFVYIK